MNDRCAAGSGRFLEVVARILGTDVDGLAELARAAEAESEISRCAWSSPRPRSSACWRAASRAEDIAAGVMRSIARRVAGLAERIGVHPPVAFTGGVALNEAMAAALGRELRERLVIPPDPRITGALGAALVAARKAGFEGVLREGVAPASRSPRPPSQARRDIPRRCLPARTAPWRSMHFRRPRGGGGGPKRLSSPRRGAGAI